MFHARRQFLADIAALGKVDRVQLIEVRVEREHAVAAEITAFRYAEGKSVFVVGVRREQVAAHFAGRDNRPRAQCGHARVRVRNCIAGRCAIPFRQHCQLLACLDRNFAAKLVHGESFDEIIPGSGEAIDQDCAIALDQKKVKQDFALRCQKCRVDSLSRCKPLNVVGDQALKEWASLGTGDGNDRTVFKMGDRHDHELVPVCSVAKGEWPSYSSRMAETFDIIIRGGTVATPNAIAQGDVGVRDGKIAAIGSLNGAKSVETFEAKGLHVLPGVIDSQCHFREPGNEHKEDLETGSRAAVLGGVTGIFEMPNTSPPTTTRAAILDKLARAAGRMHCDYAFYVGATPANIGALAELEQIPGVAGVKAFLGSSTGSLLLDHENDIAAMLRAGRRRVAVHSEDEDRLKSRKRLAITGDPRSHPVWRDAEAARLSTERVIRLARAAGRRLHVLHVTTADEIPLLADAKEFCTAETTPQHLTLTAPECYERLGTYAQMNPPIREAHHRDALWRAVDQGVIDVIGSDHAPHTRAEKDKIYPDTPSGMPGVQTLVTILLDHVNAGRLSLERFVDLTSAGAARIFGIAGKGRIAAGYDADFTIVDLKKKMTIENSWIASKCGWTPFDGMRTTGWALATIIRGKTVMHERALVDQGLGRPIHFLETLAPTP